MSTVIRPEVSKKNEWWIDRQRYYELKHFCLQYQGWCRMLTLLNGYQDHPEVMQVYQHNVSDPTEKFAELRLKYSKWIEMIDKAAKECDAALGTLVRKGVTEGLSYEVLKMKTNIPCCKDMYYDRYRKFFWILDQLRE